MALIANGAMKLSLDLIFDVTDDVLTLQQLKDKLEAMPDGIATMIQEEICADNRISAGIKCSWINHSCEDVSKEKA